MCTTSRRQSGFSLIELIIFIVVVSVGMAGILLVMNTAVRSSADPMVRKQAMALADSILEEILLKAYDDPDGGPNVVEAGRATYDDVDDFNNIDEVISAAGPIFLGLPILLNGYRVQIAVGLPAAIGGVDMKRVTVTVSRPPESITMTGYRADY